MAFLLDSAGFLPGIQRNGHNDDEALNDFLHIGRYAQKQQAVIHKAENKDTHDDAADAADTARLADAANGCSSNSCLWAR